MVCAVRLVIGIAPSAPDGAPRSRDLLGELEAHLVRVVDVRHDLDLGADVLPRRREAAAQAETAERRQRRRAPAAPARAEPGQRREPTADVGLERDVLADVDLGGHVVGREDVRRREHVGVAVVASAFMTTPNAGIEMPGAEQVRRAADVRTAHAEREALELVGRGQPRIELSGLRPP